MSDGCHSFRILLTGDITVNPACPGASDDASDGATTTLLDMMSLLNDEFTKVSLPNVSDGP